MCVGRKFKICMLTKSNAAQADQPHLKEKFGNSLFHSICQYVETASCIFFLDILITTPLRMVFAIQQEKIELHRYVFALDFVLYMI